MRGHTFVNGQLRKAGAACSWFRDVVTAVFGPFSAHVLVHSILLECLDFLTLRIRSLLYHLQAALLLSGKFFKLKVLQLGQADLLGQPPADARPLQMQILIVVTHEVSIALFLDHHDDFGGQNVLEDDIFAALLVDLLYIVNVGVLARHLHS